MEMKKNNVLMTGLAAGTAIGTLAALLFAPASGRTTRNRVKDAIKRKRQHAADSAVEAADVVAERAETARDSLSDLTEKVANKSSIEQKEDV